MATKVKGEAIKEGSIPLSALKPNRYNLSNNEDINEVKKAISEFKVGFTIIQNSYYSNVYITNISKVGGNLYNIAGISSDTTFKRIIDINNIPDPLFTENNKIDVSVPTPNWNAQEGEAGYIENKPFTIEHFDKYLNDYRYGEDTEWVIIHAHCEGSDAIILDNDYTIVFTHIGNSPLTTPFGVPNVIGNYNVETEYGSFTLGVVEYDYSLYVQIYGGPEDILHIEYDVVKPLGSQYIDNTVLKTTPQTLSDTDKNQALANLGIVDLLPYYIEISNFQNWNGVTYEYNQLLALGISPKFLQGKYKNCFVDLNTNENNRHIVLPMLHYEYDNQGLLRAVFGKIMGEEDFEMLVSFEIAYNKDSNMYILSSYIG